jgi:hypothetical protein
MHAYHHAAGDHEKLVPVLQAHSKHLSNAYSLVCFEADIMMRVHVFT